MQAMVYSAPLTLELSDVEEPTAAEGEVLVEVETVGICGSELEGFKTQSPFRVPPLIMGHRFFPGRRLDTGERVAVNPLIACRSCDLCLRGRPNICRKRKLIGIQQSGAFAELVAVPERVWSFGPSRNDEAHLSGVKPAYDGQEQREKTDHDAA